MKKILSQSLLFASLVSGLCAQTLSPSQTLVSTVPSMFNYQYAVDYDSQNWQFIYPKTLTSTTFSMEGTQLFGTVNFAPKMSLPSSFFLYNPNLRNGNILCEGEVISDFFGSYTTTNDDSIITPFSHSWNNGLIYASAQDFQMVTNRYSSTNPFFVYAWNDQDLGSDPTYGTKPYIGLSSVNQITQPVINQNYVINSHTVVHEGNFGDSAVLYAKPLMSYTDSNFYVIYRKGSGLDLAKANHTSGGLTTSFTTPITIQTNLLAMPSSLEYARSYDIASHRSKTYAITSNTNNGQNKVSIFDLTSGVTLLREFNFTGYNTRIMAFENPRSSVEGFFATWENDGTIYYTSSLIINESVGYSTLSDEGFSVVLEQNYYSTGVTRLNKIFYLEGYPSGNVSLTTRGLSLEGSR